MSIIDDVENRLERVIRSAFSRTSNSQVEPVEIASSLRRSIDINALALAAGRTLAPNNFEIHLSLDDYDRASKWGGTLAKELCDIIIEHARSQQYILSGPARVSFVQDSSVKGGKIDILASNDQDPVGAAKTNVRAPQRKEKPQSASTPKPAPRPTPVPEADVYDYEPPIARPVKLPPRSPQAPTPEDDTPEDAICSVTIDGTTFDLTHTPTIIGRASDADLSLADNGASRHHAQITLDNKPMIQDLGSTNGTYINNQKIVSPVSLKNGDVIRIGESYLFFSLTPKDSN